MHCCSDHPELYLFLFYFLWKWAVWTKVESDMKVNHDVKHKRREDDEVFICLAAEEKLFLCCEVSVLIDHSLLARRNVVKSPGGEESVIIFCVRLTIPATGCSFKQERWQQIAFSSFCFNSQYFSSDGRVTGGWFASASPQLLQEVMMELCSAVCPV